MNANGIVSQLSTSTIVELMGYDSIDGMRGYAAEKGLIPEGTSAEARDAAFIGFMNEIIMAGFSIFTGNFHCIVFSSHSIT